MTLVSVTAYHSFSGEVEASNTPTIRRLTPSCRHQLPRIALSCIEDTYIPSGSAAIKATAQVTSETGPQVGPVFRFREISKIAHLTKDRDNERNSGQSE